MYTSFMKNYATSIKLLSLAIMSAVIGTIWEDAVLVASLAFLVFILLATIKIFEASKSFKSKIKLMAIFSALLVGLVILGFTVMNPPQCPKSYTQEQIDAANSSCIVGANIGLGVYFLFLVLPAGILVLVLWIVTLLSARKNSIKR